MVSGALLLAAAAVIGAIGFDAAVYLAGVRHAQWEAEGMAKAAARALRQTGDEASALRAGTDWAFENGIDETTTECCALGDMRPVGAPDGIPETVTAVSRAERGTLFLRFFGLPGELSSRRTATAQVVAAERGPVCPWGILGDATDLGFDDGTSFGLQPGRAYSLNFLTEFAAIGDVLPLDLMGGGIPDYEEALRHGCREAETRTVSTDDLVTTLPSGTEIAGITLEALSHYYSFESGDGFEDYLNYGWCDVTFEPDSNSSGMGHTTGFSPYLQPPRKECIRGTLEGGSGRVVLVPIVARPPGDPGGAVRVLGLASMYILSWDRQSGGGEVYGMFLDRAAVGTAGLEGEGDNPLAPLRVVLVK